MSFETLRAIRMGRAGNALTAHVRTPLFRNGYALILSSTATSALGILYWVLAARYYRPEQLGVNSAILSAMIFLSALAQLNLGGVLVRFVPSLGAATRRLVLYSYSASIVASFAAGVVFIAGLDYWSPALRVIGADTALATWFVLATIAISIFSLQDSVLTALRRALLVPIENTLFALAKIGLLIVLASALPATGIFASWTIPVFFAVLPVSWLIFRRLIPEHVKGTASRAIAIAPSQVLKYAGGNYVSSIFFHASTTLLPIIVIERLGAAENAFFYLPWTITNSLQMIALNMATSFTVEVARDETKLRAYGARVLRHNLRLLVPVVAVILVGAPYILRVFGDEYAQSGSEVLRLLALSVIPYSFTALYIGLARVQQRVQRIAIMQAVRFVSVVAGSYVLLPILGITGVGLVWLGTETAIGVFLLATQLRPLVRPQLHNS
jgi:O-antigen/teichoic acid export membrane protein